MDEYRGFYIEYLDDGWYATTTNEDVWQQMGPYQGRMDAMYAVDAYLAKEDYTAQCLQEE